MYTEHYSYKTLNHINTPMKISLASLSVLEQLQKAIEQMNDEEFCQPSQWLNGASIGQHVRHSLEFFLCLKEASLTGVVNYDKRKRDQKIENERRFALSVIEQIKNFIRHYSEPQELILQACYGPSEEDTFQISTTFERELVNNIEHTVHHMALIRVGFHDICPKLKLPEDFGVASSTMRHKTFIN
jgi:hypothetical protein